MAQAPQSLEDRMMTGLALVFSGIRPEDVLPRVVDAVQLVLGAASASLMLPHPEGGLQVAFSRLEREEGGRVSGARITTGVAIRVAERNVPALLTGGPEDEVWLSGLSTRKRVGTSIVYPITHVGRLAGVLSANRGPDAPVFTGEDLARMAVFAGYARMALDNMDMFTRLEQTLEALKTEAARREQTERELRVALRYEVAGKLAAGVAHEINTPLQVISDHATFLLEAMPPLAAAAAPAAGQDEDLAYFQTQAPPSVQHIVDAVSRVARIVSVLKGITHGEAADVGPVDVKDLVTGAVEASRDQCVDVADVVVRVDEVPPVTGSAAELRETLLCLLSNAARAVGERPAQGSTRGTITVWARKVDQDTVISVADTGCGIPPAVVDRIFDPFFTTRDVGSGSGLGLTTVRSTMERHNGTVTVQSSVGRGSTFSLRLPPRVERE